MASLAMIVLTSKLWDRKMFEKYKRVLLGVLVVAGIICHLFANSIRIDNINKSLRTDLEEANKKIAELELKFETFKSLTSSEFESTWKSFATVRNNFVAIGKGLHLEKDDICPEEECQEFFQVGYKKEEKEN